MIKGYDDFGRQTKIVHFPLKRLLSAKRGLSPLNDPDKRFNHGKHRVNGSHGGIRWPYSRTTVNGHRPFG